MGVDGLYQTPLTGDPDVYHNDFAWSAAGVKLPLTTDTCLKPGLVCRLLVYKWARPQQSLALP
ncbi:MAG: hypothetical protein D8M54_20820 [Chloroflexi bacterium]|nr:hypothetical protein [Chloroflexota bacterium]